MEPILSAALARVATDLVSSIIRPRGSGAGEFRGLLEAAAAQRSGAAQLSAPARLLASRLEALPVTSAEAERIAAKAAELVARMRAAGGRGAPREAGRALQSFIAGVSERFDLSDADARRLARAVEEFAASQLQGAAGAGPAEPDASLYPSPLAGVS